MKKIKLAGCWLILGFSLPLTAQTNWISTNEIERIQQSQYNDLDRYFDDQLKRSSEVRQKAWHRNFSSPKAYEKSVDRWREQLFDLLGGNKYRKLPLRPREELVADFPTHQAFRIWIPVFENVSSYGILLRPKGQGPFPVLICVHGMTGSPESLCGLSEAPDYHQRFGKKAAEKGYLVFAPLNMNNYKKRSWLDRKAILIGERLQALEQLKIIRDVDYLLQRKDVNPRAIGAYGISWGGRTVMYSAALDKRIAACAISGHFNDFIPKMVEASPHYTAFIATPEDYAFFYNHANLFTDADVVSLICPRPVLIEQGRKDRVVYWEMSKKAFAEVHSIYEKLGLGERAEYTIFEGEHVMHGEVPLQFFDRHLRGR